MFMTFLVVALLALVVEARRIPRWDGRIVGGYDAKIEDFPYQVAIEFFGTQYCGGSIIALDRILTAAHCTYKTTQQRREFHVHKIRYGSAARQSGGTLLGVSTYHVHVGYNPSTLNNDISVLVLVDRIKISNTAQIIGFNFRKSIEGGRIATVAGWGLLEHKGNASQLLQAVSVKEVDISQCNRLYRGTITSRMICFEGEQEGKDACTGDSGGPLVSDGVQIGIVSWGRQCGSYPGVYTNVWLYRTFIEYF